MKFAPPLVDEFPFIFDSWARSWRKSPWAGCIPNHLYDQVSRAGMADLLGRARVVVGYIDLEVGRRIVGYSVSEPDRGVLHWLFVKRDYRGIGMGRALLDETTRLWPRDGWIYTYRTRASARFLRDGWEWDPAPARVKAAERT